MNKEIESLLTHTIYVFSAQDIENFDDKITCAEKLLDSYEQEPLLIHALLSLCEYTLNFVDSHYGRSLAQRIYLKVHQTVLTMKWGSPEDRAAYAQNFIMASDFLLVMSNAHFKKKEYDASAHLARLVCLKSPPSSGLKGSGVYQLLNIARAQAANKELSGAKENAALAAEYSFGTPFSLEHHYASLLSNSLKDRKAEKPRNNTWRRLTNNHHMRQIELAGYMHQIHSGLAETLKTEPVLLSFIETFYLPLARSKRPNRTRKMGFCP